MNRKYEAYAVIRYDRYAEQNTHELQHLIHIVAVVPNLEEAQAEVDRLTLLNAGKGTEYLWVYAPYFPDGRGVREANVG